MKKLTALLLAALMTVSLAACGGDPGTTTLNSQPTETTAPPVTDPPATTETEVTEPESKFDPEACREVIGTWYTAVTLDGSYLNMTDLEGSVSFDLTYTFDETGAYTISADETAFSAAIADYETLLTDYMVNSFYTKFAAESKLEGKGKTEIQTAWEEGKQAEAQTQAQTFVAGLDLTGRFAALFRSGDYYVEEGRLYTALGGDAYESSAFAVEEGNLILTDCDNAAAYRSLALTFPLTLAPAVVE